MYQYPGQSGIGLPASGPQPAPGHPVKQVIHFLGIGFHPFVDPPVEQGEKTSRSAHNSGDWLRPSAPRCARHGRRLARAGDLVHPGWIAAELSAGKGDVAAIGRHNVGCSRVASLTFNRWPMVEQFCRTR